jgi:hypothetical protein
MNNICTSNNHISHAKLECIENFIHELDKSDYFSISIIREINQSVKIFLQNIISIHSNNPNLLYVLVELVKYGLRLEDYVGLSGKFGSDNRPILNNNSTSIVSEQIASISNLFIPIIWKIKEISYKINCEILQDTKLHLDNFIKWIECNQSQVYQDNTKTFKTIQICSLVKSQYNTKPKDIPFDDFGISIKISNPNDKILFKKFIDSFEIFANPDKILGKKYDWIWKVSNSNISENQMYFLNEVWDNNYENIKNTKNVENVKNFEYELDDCVNSLSSQNSSYVPVQHIPMSDQMLFSKQLNSVQSTTLIQNYLLDNTDYTDKNCVENNVIDNTLEFNNLIVIKDESFDLPIENFNKMYGQHNNTNLYNYDDKSNNSKSNDSNLTDNNLTDNNSTDNNSTDNNLTDNNSYDNDDKSNNVDKNESINSVNLDNMNNSKCQEIKQIDFTQSIITECTSSDSNISDLKITNATNTKNKKNKKNKKNNQITITQLK